LRRSDQRCSVDVDEGGSVEVNGSGLIGSKKPVSSAYPPKGLQATLSTLIRSALALPPLAYWLDELAGHRYLRHADRPESDNGDGATKCHKSTGEQAIRSSNGGIRPDAESGIGRAAKAND
jgi:hypothetical protein